MRVLESLAHGLKIGRRCVDLGRLVAELHIFGAGLQRQLEDLVLIHGPRSGS